MYIDIPVLCSLIRVLFASIQVGDAHSGYLVLICCVLTFNKLVVTSGKYTLYVCG